MTVTNAPIEGEVVLARADVERNDLLEFEAL